MIIFIYDSTWEYLDYHDILRQGDQTFLEDRRGEQGEELAATNNPLDQFNSEAV